MSWWRMLTDVLFPAALPYTMTGLKTGLGYGWRTIIAAELVFAISGSKSGLGNYLNDARYFLKAVLRGEAPEALLDTYDSERRESALVNCEFGKVNAGHVAKLMMALRQSATPAERRELIAASRQYGNWTGLDLGIGALAISIAVRRAGPYWPVIVALACGGILVWLVGQRVGADAGLLPLVFLAGMGVFGAQLAMPAIAAGMFPLAVRGAGVGWAMGVGRMASIVAPVIGGVLIAAQIPWPTLFLIVAAPVFISMLAIILTDRTRPDRAA